MFRAAAVRAGAGTVLTWAVTSLGVAGRLDGAVVGCAGLSRGRVTRGRSAERSFVLQFEGYQAIPTFSGTDAPGFRRVPDLAWCARYVSNAPLVPPEQPDLVTLQVGGVIGGVDM